MEPYAKEGDFAISTTFYRKIRIGDVLVFRSPVDGRVLIKRVKGLETSHGGPRYFMEGDNRMRSTDSNAFGSITGDTILGKVVFIARRNRHE